jgi:ligand-binding sensor domain-containing protein
MAKFISCQLKTKSSRVLLAFWIVFCAAQAGKAERLPLNFYTSADEMASSVVNHVFRDSRGFLWFSTRDGLARFDGRDFVNYRLPTANDSRNVSFVLERRDGTYLIGGGDGLYRIARRDETFVQPEPERGQKQDADLFLGAEKVSESNFRLLYEDKSGRV